MTFWRQLFDAAFDLHAGDPAARFVPMATVSTDGIPSNRWMVFRGFDAEGNLLFVTDSESEKVSELEQMAVAELAFYFRETREQFRILGPVMALFDGPIRASAWESLTAEARRLMFPEMGEITPALRAELMAAPAPDHFLVLSLHPVRVKYLDLRTWPHRKEEWAEI